MSAIPETFSVKPFRPWTSRELRTLRENADLGAEAVAELLERSVASVKVRAHRERISLRQPGSRRGTVLGQPRGARWATLRDAADRIGALDTLRSRILSGEIDIADVERRALELLDAGAQLCPRCVCRPVLAGHRSGFCDVCWRRQLNEGLAHALEYEDARREGDRLKQANHRRREQRPDTPGDEQ